MKSDVMPMNVVAPEYREESLEMDPYEINIHEELRIRESTPHVEQQIEAMMISFQTSGQLNPIIIDEHNYLIAGYIRLIAARRLKIKIKVIKKYGLSSYQKLQMEMEENVRRKNFTSHELTIGLAQLKRKYENEHPETKWGRNQHERGDARGAFPKNEVMPSFAKRHAKLYNLSERTIQDRVRVGEAILNGNLDEKTIKLFKDDKITFSDLREKIKALDRLKVEKEKFTTQAQNSDVKSHGKNQILTKDIENQDQEEKIVEKAMTMRDVPPKSSSHQDDQIPKEKYRIKKYDSKTKGIVEEVATCKDCPLGMPFACGKCYYSHVRCIPECEEGKLGIYMGDHLACYRFPLNKNRDIST